VANSHVIACMKKRPNLMKKLAKLIKTIRNCSGRLA
jgi:hypothetical protein